MYCSVWGEEEELDVLFSVGRRGRTRWYCSVLGEEEKLNVLFSVGRRSTKINVCFSTQNQMHEKSVYAKCIYIYAELSHFTFLSNLPC